MTLQADPGIFQIIRGLDIFGIFSAIFSGGVLWFHVGRPCVRLRPSVVGPFFVSG